MSKKKLMSFADLKNIKVEQTQTLKQIDSEGFPDGWGVSCYAGGRPQQGVPQYYTEFAIEKDHYEL